MLSAWASQTGWRLRLLLVRRNRKCSLIGYVGKISVNHGLKVVTIVAIGEASSLESISRSSDSWAETLRISRIKDRMWMGWRFFFCFSVYGIVAFSCEYQDCWNLISSLKRKEWRAKHHQFKYGSSALVLVWSGPSKI